MHARFAQSSALVLAGAFLVVASQVFVPATTAWLAFAIGVGSLLAAAVPFALGARSRTLALDGLLAVLAGWTVVASLIFAGTTVQWLSFAEGAAFAAVGVAGLAADHLLLTRQVRQLSATATPETVPAAERRPVAA